MSDALGIYREKRFSPGKVGDDRAILHSTAAQLRDAELRVQLVEAETLGEILDGPRIVFTMCQSIEALAVLDSLHCPVVNSPGSIRGCFRLNLVPRLEEARVPQPRWRIATDRMPRDLGAGPWLKRGDVHAMEAADVRRIFEEEEWHAALEAMRRRGVPAAIVQEHREGEVYKFYGVAGGFFRAYGLPAGREADAARLAGTAANAIGLSAYGGDGVCAPDGTLTLIDLNDWPSFSRCRDEAARAISEHLLRVLENTR